MTRSRYILIGDVHGCLTELQALICRIAPKPDDTLVFLGDLVDKGPESPGVVQLGSPLVHTLPRGLNRRQS